MVFNLFIIYLIILYLKYSLTTLNKFYIIHNAMPYPASMAFPRIKKIFIISLKVLI